MKIDDAGLHGDRKVKDAKVTFCMVLRMNLLFADEALVVWQVVVSRPISSDRRCYMHLCAYYSLLLDVVCFS